MNPFRAAYAEFVGTFAFVFVGAGAIIVSGGESLVAIALAHGLMMAVMVSATLHISGGQINPAVSIALGIIGKQTWKQAGIFTAAQLAAGVLAAVLLKVLLSPAAASQIESVRLGATIGVLTNNGDQTAPLAALGLEILATFVLMFTIMGVVVDNRGVGRAPTVAGLAIGLCIAALIFFIGPMTGASMNPARSLGPAAIAGAWNHHWVYWVGPIIGAVLAAVSYRVVFDLDKTAD